MSNMKSSSSSFLFQRLSTNTMTTTSTTASITSTSSGGPRPTTMKSNYHHITTNNGSATSTSRSTIINQNSVQTQFDTLIQNKTILQNQTKAFDNERQNEEKTLLNLRHEQTILSEEIRKAHATLGIQTKKLEMMNGEKNRLEVCLNEDRCVMDQLSNELECMVQEEMKKKVMFVKEMEVLNLELEDALRRCEEKEMEFLISTDNSCGIIMDYVKAELKKTHDHTRKNHRCDDDTTSSNGNHYNVIPPQDNNINTTNSKWEKILKDIHSSIESFQDSNSDYDQLDNTYKSLKCQIEDMRKKALNMAIGTSREQLNDVELDQLESVWMHSSTPLVLDDQHNTMEQDYDDQKKDEYENQSINMHLFYGTTGSTTNTNTFNHGSTSGGNSLNEYDTSITY